MAQEVSKVDVYKDDKGNFVGGDDPNVAIQLAHKGVAIPRKLAARHGLNLDGSRVNAPAVKKEPDVAPKSKPEKVTKVTKVTKVL